MFNIDVNNETDFSLIFDNARISYIKTGFSFNKSRIEKCRINSFFYYPAVFVTVNEIQY